MAMNTSTPADVVILGGGVAGLEAMMTLHEIAPDHVRVTLVAGTEDFVERPMTVGEPFGRGAPRRVALRDIAADFGANFVLGEAVGVSSHAPRLVLAGGESIGADALLLAPGARGVPPFPDALTFGLDGSVEAMREVLDGIVAGAVRSVAFVMPSLAGWALPLYELALMTGRAVAAADVAGVALHFVTPEEWPLVVFGGEPSALVARQLEAAGIAFHGATYADVTGGTVGLRREGARLEVDRVVTMPLLRAPRLEGVPRTASGFIPVDRHGRVAGRDGLYAAGDAIEFPVKQGGIAAAQGIAAAEHIAARHGAPVDPEPFRPVLRGLMLTGGAPQFMRAARAEPHDHARVSWQPLWWPPTKIAGPHLAPYLSARDIPVAWRPPSGFVEIDVPVGDDE